MRSFATANPKLSLKSCSPGHRREKHFVAFYGYLPVTITSDAAIAVYVSGDRTKFIAVACELTWLQVHK
jgi:hypothetical protein